MPALPRPPPRCWPASTCTRAIVTGGPSGIGVETDPLSRTARRYELQFATNHLGHFALATGLHRALAAAGGARIVSVSSVGHVNTGVDFDDIHFDRRPYDKWVA